MSAAPQGRATSTTYVQHKFVSVHVDAQGWVQFGLRNIDHVTSIVWHKDVHTILTPQDPQIEFAYVLGDASTNVINLVNKTLALNTRVVSLDVSFWTQNKAFVLITQEDDHTVIYKVVTLTNLDGQWSHETIATTTSTTTTTVTTTPVSTPTTNPTVTDETTTTATTTTITDSTTDTTTTLVSTTTTTTSSVVTEMTTSKTKSSSHGKTKPASSSSSAPPSAFSEEKATDVKTNVDGAASASTQRMGVHANVAIIALSVFGVFVLCVVIVVALGSGSNGKEKADADMYLVEGSYDFEQRQQPDPDTRAKDLLILQSLGKGASAEFQANL